jgi:DNA-binding MarR family transcriptional regulator
MSEELPQKFRFRNKAELLRNLAQKYSDFVHEAAEFIASLQAATHALDDMRERQLERYGLSQGKLYVLAYLFNEEIMQKAPPGASDIAEALCVSPATITGLLDGLERDGYLDRSRSVQDRRALLIHLTEKGRRFLDEYMPQQTRRVEDWLAPLTSDERRELAALLSKLGGL